MIGHAKLFGDGFVGLAVDEEGAQSEVAAVAGLRRLDEALAAKGVIHAGEKSPSTNPGGSQDMA